MIEREPVTEFLPCKLTDQEMMQAAKELAACNQDLEALEDRKKRVNDDIKAEVSKKEAEVSVNARKISTGEEYRNISCEWEKDYTTGVKRLFRLDTSEIVKTRNIDPQERQAYLAGLEKQRKEAASDAASTTK